MLCPLHAPKYLQTSATLVSQPGTQQRWYHAQRPVHVESRFSMIQCRSNIQSSEMASAPTTCLQMAKLCSTQECLSIATQDNAKQLLLLALLLLQSCTKLLVKMLLPCHLHPGQAPCDRYMLRPMPLRVDSDVIYTIKRENVRLID